MKSYACIVLAAVFFAGCNSNPSDVVNNNTGTSLAPGIVWTDPWPGAVGPNIMSPGNVVLIRFSTLMNTRSVIHAVSIAPSNQSVFIDTTRSAPVEGTTFSFPLTPTQVWLIFVADARLDSRFPPSYQIYYPYLKVGQQYTVTVGPSVADIYGDTLGAPISFSFTPEPYLRVTNTYPSDGDSGISPLYPTATIRFNAPIDTGSARGAFSISPEVAGNVGVYYSDWGFYWYQSSPGTSMLESETKYTARIAATMKDLNGNQMPQAYSFSFTTAPYAVTSTSPTGTVVSRSASIYVNCNFLVDSTSIAPSFSIGPDVACGITYNGSSFTLTPSALLASNTAYTVTISTGLRAVNGTSIKNPYTFSFTTGN